MDAWENEPWAPFVDRFAKELLEHGVTEAAVVIRNSEEDRVFTNYFNCNFEKRCVLVGHLIEDIVLEIIETNADTIREILGGE